MENLPKIINQYPELLNITKPSLQNGIFYSEQRYNLQFIDALILFYKFYFEIEPVLIIPSCFKEIVPGLPGNLDFLEQLKENSKVVIFAYADILFNDIIKINKRRLNTILKNINKKSKVIILSITTLKSLEIPILETFYLHRLDSGFSFKNLNLNLFDLTDQDSDVFKSNIDSFIEMINDFKDKSIYISLNLPINKILFIESQLKLNNIVFRKEPDKFEKGIVLNSSKTTQNLLLKNYYDIYIFVLPDDLPFLDILYYFKDILSEKTQEVYIDASNNNIIEDILMKIYKESNFKLIAKDSKEEFDTIKSIKIENAILATDDYYKFESPESIQKLDLCNLTKKDYDLIRNYIKIKLTCKFDLDIKTCQLSTPCSPKDRSRKLNSLSNKISSIDYRCDVTCEIFKDYTIGVVIWNEMFVNKEQLNVLKNEVYIYQTTTGKWRYTTII